MMGLIKMWEGGLKNLDIWDIGLIKFGSMALILFLITVWTGAMNLVHSIHWGWFLVALIVLMARPFKRAYL
ncbi:MAG: hypothetical protein KJI71_05550 [Patescibacteria group bacterium]|nr:hypothetical protein [Patescibacteria group bacterium]